MGTNVTLVLERRFGDGTWGQVRPFPKVTLTLTKSFGDGTYEKDLEPDIRGADVYAFIADVCNPDLRTAHFANRGLPDDRDSATYFDPEDDYEEEYGPDAGDHRCTHATLGELRAIEQLWRDAGLWRSDFVQWIFSPQVTSLVETYGGDNLRLLFAFNS